MNEGQQSTAGAVPANVSKVGVSDARPSHRNGSRLIYYHGGYTIRGGTRHAMVARPSCHET